MGTLRHDNSFDRLRNLPAIPTCVVFVTTSPGLPYIYMTVLLDFKNSEKLLSSHCLPLMICAAVKTLHIPGHLYSISKYTYPPILIVFVATLVKSHAFVSSLK